MEVIGVPTPQLDARDKVTGKAKYCADIFLQGELYGAILRSPHAHARIVRVDTAPARELKGVVEIVAAGDTTQKKYGSFIKDEYLFAKNKVRYVGDEIAAVAAVDRVTAKKALGLIQVSYELLPPVFDPKEALRPGAPVIHEESPGNLAEEYVIERGNIAVGFSDSACIIEESFALPLVNTCYLEPTTCLADIDQSGKITVWAPTGSPFRVRDVIAHLLDLPVSRVRVIKPAVGGNFGARHLHKNAFIAALLTLKTKRPVKIGATRFEEFYLARPRMAASIYLRMGFSGNGLILAKETEIIADNGAYTDSAPRVLETMAQRADNLYRISNVRTKVALVYTNRVPTGAYRGYGNPQMHFALESLMDMAAEKLGMDPLEVRRINATRKGDITVHGWNISSCGLEECIDKVRREANWDSKRASWGSKGANSGTGAGTKKRGIGMACMIHVAGRRSFPGYWGSTAWVQVSGLGKIVVSSGEADVGQGCNTAFAQIAAEALGVPLETVEVAPLDTDRCPYALGSYSDRVTILGGGAVKLAAEDAKAQLVQLATEYFSVPQDQVTYEKGCLFVTDLKKAGSPRQGQGSDHRVSIFDLVRHVTAKRGEFDLVGRGTHSPADVVFRNERIYGNNAAAYTFAAQVAEVEVDVHTGQVKVLGFTCAHDLGRVINPLAAEGQIEGALMQGLGYALMEEMIVKDGELVNPSFLEYKVPTTCDTFFPKVMLVESDEPNGPFGAKGVAEPGLVPTAPAIANAIYHATGVRVTRLPITPEALLESLKDSALGG